jgi:thiol-disulfide isomerase/thioredoxin
VGTEIRTLELQALTGDAGDLQPQQWRGKVVFLNFWGPWCGPCGVEFPHLVQLEQQFRARDDFRFVSVSCSGGPGDERSMEVSTAAFLKQQQAGFPTYRDANAIARTQIMYATQLGTANDFAYPTTVILGRDGKIRGLWQGYADGDELAMLEVVQAALQEK